MVNYNTEMDYEVDNLLENYEFKKQYEGQIPPSKDGKYHKKNKNCKPLYRALVEDVRKEKEVGKL